MAEFRLRYDPGGGGETDHDFYADRVIVEEEVDGDVYDVLDDSVEADIRKIRLRFTVSGVWETTSSSTKTAARILRDLQKGSDTIRFFPDKSNSSAYENILLDLRHRPTLMATRRGNVQLGQELRFIGSTWHDPTDAILDEFDQLTSLI